MSNVDHNLQSKLWWFVSMDENQLCKTVLKGHTSKPCKWMSFIFKSTTRQTYAKKVSLFFFTVKLIFITCKNKNNSMFLHPLGHFYTFLSIFFAYPLSVIHLKKKSGISFCWSEATLDANERKFFMFANIFFQITLWYQLCL